MEHQDRLLQQLETATLVADWSAQSMVASELPQKSEWLRDIVDAIAKLLEVRERVYTECPQLRPETQDAGEPSTPAYGPDNPMPAAIRDWLKLHEAVDVLRCLAAGPNPVLARIVAGELGELEAQLDAFPAAD